MHHESTLFRDANVLVTDAKFVTAKHSIAMSAITGVNGAGISQDYIPQLIVMALGLIMAFAGAMSLYSGSTFAISGCFGLGTVYVIIGGYWAHTRKPTFGIILHTAEGELMAYSSNDRKQIASILSALSIACGESSGVEN